MKLNIINEYNIYVGCDLEIAEYAVKIELRNYPLRPAFLLSSKNGVPMLAKEFVERVKQCRETGKSLSIDYETDKEPKAWISGRDNEGNVENAKCKINTSENTVLIRVVEQEGWE